MAIANQVIVSEVTYAHLNPFHQHCETRGRAVLANAPPVYDGAIGWEGLTCTWSSSCEYLLCRVRCSCGNCVFEGGVELDSVPLQRSLEITVLAVGLPVLLIEAAQLSL